MQHDNLGFSARWQPAPGDTVHMRCMLWQQGFVVSGGRQCTLSQALSAYLSHAAQALALLLWQLHLGLSKSSLASGIDAPEQRSWGRQTVVLLPGILPLLENLAELCFSTCMRIQALQGLLSRPAFWTQRPSLAETVLP